MKNLFKIGFAALASVMLLAACNDNSGDTTTPGDGTTKIKASVSAAKPAVEGETRLHLGGNKTDGFTLGWDANEKIGIFTETTEGAEHHININEPFVFASKTDDDVASFTGDLTIKADSSDSHNIYAYYPYSLAVGDEHDILMHSIPTTQTLRAGGMYDPMAEIMISTPLTKQLDDNSASGLTIDDLFFNRKVTMINICAGTKTAEWAGAILPLLDTETIQSVTFTAPAGIVLAGDFLVDLNDPAGELAFDDEYNSVTAVLETPQSFADLNVWILTAPFEYQGGSESFDIELVTENYIVTRTFSFDNSVKFNESTVNLLALNFISGYTVTPKTPVENWVQVFYEDFSSITTGNSTEPGDSGFTWDGGSNFTVSSAFQAGGAVRLGAKSTGGSLTTKNGLDLSNKFKITITGKAWINKSTGDIKITIDSQEQTMSFGTGFETKTIEFQAATNNSKIKIVTLNNSDWRVFIDDIKVEVLQ